ncbi:FtsX-like permease family protein [compost metagenome]
MINSLLGLAFRFFKANKFLALSSIVSIMLSISLILTMSQLSVNAEKSLRQETIQLFGEMDFSIGYNLEKNKVVDTALLQKLTSYPQIERYSSVLITNLRVDALRANIYTVGVENDKLAKSKYHFKQDLTQQDIILNKSLAESLGKSIGEQINVSNNTYRVVEIIPDLNSSGLTTDVIFMAREQVEKVMYENSGVQSEATYLLVKVKKDADLASLTASMQAIDTDLRIDLAEENEFLVNNLRSFNIFIIIVSVLVLIGSSIFIISNFESFMYKYNIQMSIMRSIGATRKQIFNVVLIQLGIINICGTVSGYFLALVSNTFAQRWLQVLFDVQYPTMIFDHSRAFLTIIVAILFIQLLMIIPSIRSSRTLPLKIVQKNEDNDFSYKRVNLAIGISLLLIGVFLVLVGLITGGSGSGALFYVFSSIFLMLGILRLFPAYLPALLFGIAPILKKLAGNLSFVAIRNTIPQVRKNIYVIYTISILIIITIVGSTLFETIKFNSERDLKTQYPVEIVVTSRVGHNSTIDPESLTKLVSGIEEVESVSTISTAQSGKIMKESRMSSFNYGLADLKQLEKQELLRLDTKAIKDSIIITTKFASENQLQVGDQVDIWLYSESEQRNKKVTSVNIAYILDKLPGSNYDAYLDWSNAHLHTSFTKFEKMFIDSSDNDRVINQLSELKKFYPGQLEFNSYEQALIRSKSMFDQRWSIFIVVLIIVFISVAMGVYNTLISNIQSKRKEYALLRTFSVTRGGLVQVIMTQVILFITLGILLGVIVGYMFTFIIGLNDIGNIYMDINLVSFISFVIMVIAIIIFIPITYRLSKSPITTELTQESK